MSDKFPKVVTNPGEDCKGSRNPHIIRIVVGTGEREKPGASGEAKAWSLLLSFPFFLALALTSSLSVG